MQFLKRFGLFLLDLSLLILSLILTLFLTGEADHLCPSLFWPAFFLGSVASIFLFFWLRKRSYKFKLEREATFFLAARRAAALYPRRTKYFQRIRRRVLWLPSACAFFVLFFFPQATHVAHPGAHRLVHNQVHIPWKWSIILVFETPTDNSSGVYTIMNTDAPWPFGNKSLWSNTARISGATFSSLKATEVLERRHYRALWPQDRKTMASSLEFNSQGITLSCLRYLRRPNGDDWIVECETTSPLQERNFQANFLGAAEDIPAFYKIVQNVAPAN
jgi:hypothetical protein